MLSAATFCSSHFTRFVPGMGTTGAPRRSLPACTQARASCAAVTPLCPQPVRAHARRNREKLLAAAQDEFNRVGKNASLGGIAKAAGVGIATLYRHFPDRESLVLATYEYEVDQLCSAADSLLKTLPPDQALREWMRRLADLLVTKQQMSEALQSMNPSDGGWASESY